MTDYEQMVEEARGRQHLSDEVKLAKAEEKAQKKARKKTRKLGVEPLPSRGSSSGLTSGTSVALDDSPGAGSHASRTGLEGAAVAAILAATGTYVGGI